MQDKADYPAGRGLTTAGLIPSSRLTYIQKILPGDALFQPRQRSTL